MSLGLWGMSRHDVCLYIPYNVITERIVFFVLVIILYNDQYSTEI